MLTCYREIYLAHTPRIGSERLLRAANTYYFTRKTKKWANVPMPKLCDPIDDDRNIRLVRNLRRYIQRAEQIVQNVAAVSSPDDIDTEIDRRGVSIGLPRASLNGGVCGEVRWE